jgi:hypothetical protein
MDFGSLGWSVQVRQVERRKQGGKASGVEPRVRARPNWDHTMASKTCRQSPKWGIVLLGQTR